MTTIKETPGVQGGEPCVAGTRIPVRSIVEARRLYAEDDAGFFGYTARIGLSSTDVGYVLAWALDHYEQIEAIIRDQHQALAELEARCRSI